MRAWELEKSKNYTCDGITYMVDKDGDLHEKKVLKRNGCESWFLCSRTFNEIRHMTFTEVK